MTTQYRNFLWDFMVSVAFVSVSAWSAHTIRGEGAFAQTTMKPRPACALPIFHWPQAPHDKSFARERSEMPAAVVVP